MEQISKEHLEHHLLCHQVVLRGGCSLVLLGSLDYQPAPCLVSFVEKALSNGTATAKRVCRVPAASVSANFLGVDECSGVHSNYLNLRVGVAGDCIVVVVVWKPV